MRNQSGFISSIYLIGGLALFGGIASYGLWKQVQKNGEQRAIIAQKDADILAAKTAYDDLSRERKRADIIVLDNLELKEVKTVKERVYVDKIIEVMKDAPPTDCVNTIAHPVILECLRDSVNCSKAGESLPALRFDERLSYSGI